jgi:3-dehydroquinate dehydratase type I
MICVSLAEPTLAGCFAALVGLPFAEIRMDRMHLSAVDVHALFSSHRRLIATCRPGEFPDEEREELLIAAIDAGAAYVDVEVDSEGPYRDAIVARARQAGCEVIVSFHDHHRTPDRAELEARRAACFEAGADIAKIACKAHTGRDNARLLGLLDDRRKVVVIAMGAEGRITRVVAPLLGSPFTFASSAEGRETAEGQMDRETLFRLMETVRRGTDT